MRRLLSLACVAIIALAALGPGVPSAVAEDLAASTRLEGAPGVITPPDGDWKPASESLASGQWYLEYRAPGDDTVMRVHVFPARPGSTAESTLVQAIDVFFRGMGVQGFGILSRQAVDVWGCPGAQGAVMADIAGHKVSGRARIVRLSEKTWGFAIGYTRASAEAERRDAMRAFVGSLEPIEPVFYERRFHTPKTLARPAVRVPGDKEVTAGQIAAVARVLEAGIGARYPVALKAPIRAALVADALKGTTRTRGGYRATAEALEAAEAFEPEKRDANLRALGRRILEAILKRATGGYEPAVQFAAVWHEFRSLRVGTVEDGLTAGNLANRIEMSEFLASIAEDLEVRVQGEPRHALVLQVHEQWKDVPKVERAGWREIGALWSALRYAWDNATPASRLAFRRTVAGTLNESTKMPLPEDVRTARQLKRYLADRKRGKEQEALSLETLRRAFDLSIADRRTLIDTLGVEDTYGFHFGW